MANVKIYVLFQISICKVWNSKWYHVKALRKKLTWTKTPHSYLATSNEPWSGLSPSIYDTILQSRQNEAANYSKCHWWRDLDGFWKLCVTFKNLLLFKNISLQHHRINNVIFHLQTQKLQSFIIANLLTIHFHSN